VNNFQRNIIERFNLKDEDYIKIKLLFLFSFALGLFVAFYFVPANSQFLNNFGHQELPLAYIFSGVVGVISISFYSYVQKKRQSKYLFTSVILLMTLIALLSRILLLLTKNNVFSNNEEFNQLIIKYLSFFVFIWAWPFIALVATITGGIAIRLFNLLQVKKFYGFINLGGVLAAIISYFIIPFTVNYVSHQYDIILFGIVGLGFAVYLLFYIFNKFPEQKIEQETVTTEFKIPSLK